MAPACARQDAMRHDLDGRAVEPVSEEHRTGALKAIRYTMLIASVTIDGMARTDRIPPDADGVHTLRQPF